MNIGDLLLGRQSKGCPLGLGNNLVILDDLLRVTAVEDELYDRLVFAPLRPLGQFNERVVYAVASRSGADADDGAQNAQMRSPRRLPIICREYDLVLDIDDEVLVVPHNIRHTANMRSYYQC